MPRGRRPTPVLLRIQAKLIIPGIDVINLEALRGLAPYQYPHQYRNTPWYWQGAMSQASMSLRERKRTRLRKNTIPSDHYSYRITVKVQPRPLIFTSSGLRNVTRVLWEEIGPKLSDDPDFQYRLMPINKMIENNDVNLAHFFPKIVGKFGDWDFYTEAEV